MTSRSHLGILIILFLLPLCCTGQESKHLFRIRTITAGITLINLSDTVSIHKAIDFLIQAKQEYVSGGYNVQTLRIATQHIYEYSGGQSVENVLATLRNIDRISRKKNVSFSIGQLSPPDVFDVNAVKLATGIIEETNNINFSLSISSAQRGIHARGINLASQIIIAISKIGEGGEGNFRFTASANCPAGIPFFPAAFHQGENSFAIGLESPNLITAVFRKAEWSNAREMLKAELESKFKPIEAIATKLSVSNHWKYDGIDTSPAPGLDASIGEAIETLTHQPFGESSTLSACALITDVIKDLDIKRCGYSGLMLPVIEDKILAKRAEENKFSIQELLLFSAVSGTGLDVIPMPGDTPQQTIERILRDVASLSLKYESKALSARLFLIPGKNAGDRVEFNNPYLTASTLMKVE